jgi:aryl-alcohol dehydrogenase-like predicted oxidoreductase
MNVSRRLLGVSGLEITSVGFGAWAVGGGGWRFGWGPQDDTLSIDAIHRAVDLGVNWVDTAAIYGLGHSEEVVGRAVRALPAADRPLIFTKCGIQWDVAHPMGPTKLIVTPHTVRDGIEDSLRRLGLDYVDLFQIHQPDEEGNPVEDAWAEMVKLRDEGKAVAIGVSNFDPGLLARCEAIGHVDSLQPPFSLISRGMANSELMWCREHNTGVICYSPMKAGILTDAFGADRVAAMPDDDWRTRDDAFKEPWLTRNLSLRDALRPIARRHDRTVAAVAVAWVISWPGVTGAIVGARSPQQVEGWIGAAELELTQTDFAEIAAAVERTGAGEGPAYPSRA